MKATGIVRRIDDLGRVVIPKEIRRVMRIRDGDPLEIYTAVDGEVIFKKYSPVGEMGELPGSYAEALTAESGFGVVICDRDRVIAAAGCSKKELLDRRISSALERLTEARQTYFHRAGEADRLMPFEESELTAAVAAPILTAGDVAGAVIFLAGENNKAPGEADVRLCRLAASLLGRQMEE